ncbi:MULTISPECIES: IS66 family insertion sequence element accessory protein TnpB [unclassified Mesorhizobium]|uniref:IS66 family insertion sequence element accessory protein TnpB n=1 Tax=unclassified Mesorhizobium TaxID=325217 RepID=UPI0009FBFC83
MAKPATCSQTTDASDRQPSQSGNHMQNVDNCGNLIKIIWHDRLGMSLYAKRLEKSRFLWPSPADGKGQQSSK